MIIIKNTFIIKYKLFHWNYYKITEKKLFRGISSTKIKLYQDSKILILITIVNCQLNFQYQ